MRRVVIYVRVSTQEQATEGYSIGEQLERLRLYCQAHGWILVEEYIDPGYSGANLDRPAISKLISDIGSGTFDTVLVYKLDRLSRSQKDTMHLIEDVFMANNIDFISMSENFDTSTPLGRAMIGILSVFAQLERDQIKERMGMGKEARAKEGKWQGGSTVPVGYEYDVSTGELIINEYEAMQVREVFNLVLSGMPYKTIANKLTAKGYTYNAISGHVGIWDAKRIKYVLTNKLYIGYIRYKDTWFPGTHEPIIDTETFEKAQLLFKERSASNVVCIKKRQGQTSYLGGLLYCKKCGARYARNSGKKWKNNEPPLYYSCYSRSHKVPKMIKDPNCKNKTWRMTNLDNIVLDEIKKLSLEPEYINTIKERETSKQDTSNKADILKKEIRKIEEQVSRFLDLYGLGAFTIEQVTAKVQPLNQRKQDIEQELIELVTDETILSEDETREIVRNFDKVLERSDFNEIRMTIDSLVRYIELNDDTVYIHWKFT